MASLGTFGTAYDAPAEPDTFDYFGATIRVNPALSDLDLADFLDLFGDLDVDNLKPAQAITVMQGLKQHFRALVHPDDFAEFWRLARANRQGTVDLLAISMALIESVTSRPTKRPAVSTDGPSSTPTSSQSAAVSIVESAYPDRPDLQLAALRAVE